MPARALVLINPGARRAGTGYEEVAGGLESLGIPTVVEVAGEASRIPDQVRRHREEVDRVVVGGGDGTLHHAVRRRIVLGWVNGRYFFTTASIGLSVRITEELSAESKQRWGPLAYGLTALRVLRRTRPFHARITWQGGGRVSRTVQIVVGNGRYYGTALPVAEDATIDDARLDLYSLEVRRWWQLLALAPALKRGRHGEKDAVKALRATGLEIHTRTRRDIDVDGEIGGTTPARFRVLPGALEVFAPLSRMT